jgi:hypothetical protein
MEYKSLTIREVLKKIQRGSLYLPAIQRKFVWGHKQVELLFDSIMRDYPIGTFLLWFVEKERFGDYAFYQFIKDYHERDNWKNRLADHTHLGDELIGVLDGQQRLNSMYVALQGTYAYKRPRMWRTSPGAYPIRRFYLNVFKPEIEEEDDDFVYEFRFRTEKQAGRVDPDHCWYPVGNLLRCQDLSDITDEWDAFSAGLPEALASDPDLSRRGRNHLARLWQRLTQSRLINYFPVHSQDLDDILDIFVRVNSAGKPLSRTDLLFSTIVAHWEEGRDKIELFLEGINERGNGFRFGTDFMMRAALVLAGCPTRLRVASFKRENVERIVDSWESIEKSIEAAVDLLVKWGFQGATLTASNGSAPLDLTRRECNTQAGGERVLSTTGGSGRDGTEDVQAVPPKFKFNVVLGGVEEREVGGGGGPCLRCAPGDGVEVEEAVPGEGSGGLRGLGGGEGVRGPDRPAGADAWARRKSRWPCSRIFFPRVELGRANRAGRRAPGRARAERLSEGAWASPRGPGTTGCAGLEGGGAGSERRGRSDQPGRGGHPEPSVVRVPADPTGPRRGHRRGGEREAASAPAERSGS